MAGRRIEDQIDAPRGQARPGSVSRPGVFTDLKADTDAATVKPQIADRHTSAIDGEVGPPSLGPGSKPARLVVDACAGQMLLADQPRQPAVHQHRRGVVGRALKPHW